MSVKLNSLASKALFDKNKELRIQTYIDAIEQSLNDDSIYNIALSGSYGSGKSTVLKTFKSQNPHLNIINISLGNIDNENTLKPDNNQVYKRYTNEKQIELSILQQIIFHVNPNSIPDSKFKRIINKSEIIRKRALILMFLPVAVYTLYTTNIFIYINPKYWTYYPHHFSSFIFLLIFIYLFIAGFILIEWILKSTQDLYISKFNPKGEIELGRIDDNKKSLLNQHIDEIIYFFETTKYSIVIIEDIDRFEHLNINIFNKLREVNFLINNNTSISSKKRVRFIYAVKDTLFTEPKNRTKFFDIIIPVIPHITPLNSADKLMQKIDVESEELDYKFINETLINVSNIDTRVLLNILNEFRIYKKVLGENEILHKSLFTMIVYKNIEPIDFDDLCNNTGRLYSVIHHNYYQKIKNSLITKKEQIEKQIEEEGHSINIADKLTKIKTKIENLQIVKLSEIFNYNFDLHSILEEQFSNEQTINFCFSSIKNGHIDFNYFNFISINHESDITYDDFKFLRILTQHKSPDLELVLKNIKNTIDRINFQQLSNVSILNFSLFEYLLKHEYVYKKELLGLGQMLSENLKINKTNEFYDFSFRFFFKEKSSFSNSINSNSQFLKKHPSIILKLILNRQTNYNWTKHLLYYLFNNLTTNVIKENCNTKIINSFNIFLSNNYLIAELGTKSSLINPTFKKVYLTYIDILNGTTSTTDIIPQDGTDDDFAVFETDLRLNPLSYMKENSLKFKTLLPTDEIETLEEVYKNNLYDLNRNNIKLVYQYFNSKKPLQDNFPNYSDIINSDCLELLEYINSNWNDFFENYLGEIDESKYEDEGALIEIVHNEDVNIEDRKNFFSNSETQISSYDLMPDESPFNFQFLIEEKIIKPTWQNIYAYYSISETITPTLYRYLNDIQIAKSITSTPFEAFLNKKNISIDERNEFCEQMYRCDELRIKSYEAIISSIDYDYRKLDISELSEDKVDFLIKNGNLNLSDDLNDIFEESFPERQIDYLIANESLILRSINDTIHLEAERIIQFLEKCSLSAIDKEKIILEHYADEVKTNGELAKLLIQYLQITNSNIKDDKILKSIIINSNAIELKESFLVRNLENFNIDEVISLTSLISVKHEELFIFRKRPKLRIYENTIELIDKLKDKGLVGRTKVSDNNIIIHTKSLSI